MTKARDLADNSEGSKPKVIDAKGDLIVGTGADAAARLAVASTAGYLLTVDSGETTGLKWAAPAAGGALTSLASGSLAVSSTGVDLTSISQSYTELWLHLKDLRMAANGLGGNFILNNDTGSNYYGIALEQNGGNTSTTIRNANTSFEYQNFNVNSAANEGYFVLVKISFYAESTAYKPVHFITGGKAGNSPFLYDTVHFAGYWKDESAIDRITVRGGGAGYLEGTYELLGLK
jgi:hypothetical protein